MCLNSKRMIKKNKIIVLKNVSHFYINHFFSARHLDFFSPIFHLWSSPNINPGAHSPFYSAPSIFAVLRDLVQEIWFENSASANSDFFSGLKKWLSRKKVVLVYKSTFFQVGGKWFFKLGFFFLVREKWLTRKKIQVCRTTFLEPLFYTFLEKWLQIKWSIAMVVWDIW